MVSANGLNHCPATPYMKATGTNTATIEKVVAATASPISSVPSCAAVVVVLPHLDVAHDVLPHHDGVVDQDADGEREAEQRHRVEREAEGPDRDERRPARDTGSARPVITVERQELRKRNTTSTVSSAPSISASSTLRTELRTRSPASRTTSSLTPGGSVAAAAVDVARGSRR